MRKILIFIFVGSCVVLFNSGCHSGHVEKEEEIKFLVTSPLKKDTSITREYVCQIRSIQHIEMRALKKGYLENMYVDEGQSVKKGQMMFKIMPLIYNAELQKAQADYMEVLLTQRDALEAKFELIETKRRQMNARINIYKALGGGWS